MVLFFVGFSFLEARAVFGQDKVGVEGGQIWCWCTMNACYLAMDPFIDVINIRSRLEGDE